MLVWDASLRIHSYITMGMRCFCAQAQRQVDKCKTYLALIKTDCFDKNTNGTNKGRQDNLILFGFYPTLFMSLILTRLVRDKYVEGQGKYIVQFTIYNYLRH